VKVLPGREALRTPWVRENVAFRDAHARFVRGEVVGRHELQRMRGDDGQLQRGRERDRLLHIRFAARLPAALQLDIEAVREDARPALGVASGRLVVAGRKGDADVALLRAGQREQPFGKPAFEPLNLDFRAAAILVREPRLGQQLAEVQIAAPVLHEQ
jgi:hypothetical protein